VRSCGASSRRRTGATKKVRFVGPTPDLAGPAREALWGELLAADLDYFNTDDLAGLEAFLDAHE
jgi:hypothetical protein